MQTDIHHAGTYTLCRMAGMKSDCAEIVAYCAEQVDDAVYGHALMFENGGTFKQTQTAYKRMNPDNLDINRAYEVLVTFHFLPDIKAYKNDAALATNPDSKLLEKSLEDIVLNGDTELGLYRLGIGLHTYEDVFAHQDFIGFYSDYNDVNLIDGMVESIKISLFKNQAKIGHGPVGHNADIPFMNWSYKRENKEEKTINNLEDRFLPGLKEVYQFIKRFVQENPQYKINGAVPASFEEYENKIKDLLAHEGDKEERHNYWLDSIANNKFDFEKFNQKGIDKNLEYHEREWFKKAVEVVEEKPENIWDKVGGLFRDYLLKYDDYRKKDCFKNSNWVKFMLAAEEHKHVVNRKIIDL